MKKPTISPVEVLLARVNHFALDMQRIQEVFVLHSAISVNIELARGNNILELLGKIKGKLKGNKIRDRGRCFLTS